jgi:hypothetical protein
LFYRSTPADSGRQWLQRFDSGTPLGKAKMLEIRVRLGTSDATSSLEGVFGEKRGMPPDQRRLKIDRSKPIADFVNFADVRPATANRPGLLRVSFAPGTSERQIAILGALLSVEFDGEGGTLVNY